MQPNESDGGSAGRREVSIGPVLAVAGGVMLVVGSLLAWVDVEAVLLSESIRGIDTVHGVVALVCGLVASAVGVAVFTGRDVAPVLLTVVGIASLVAATIAVGSRASIGAEALAQRTATVEGTSIEQARDVVDLALRFGTVDVSGSAGVYLAVAGAGCVLASAWLVAIGRRSRVNTARRPLSRIVVDAPSSRPTDLPELRREAPGDDPAGTGSREDP